MTPRPEYDWHYDPQGWFRWSVQFDRLLRERRPPRCVEVGVWLGLSAIYTAERLALWGGHLWGIDTWRGSPEFQAMPAVLARVSTSYDRFCANVWHRNVQETITPIIGTSASAVKDLDVVPEWIYIDGSHAYADVLEDLTVWWPRLAPGGIMLGDDYQMDDVRNAWLHWVQPLGQSLNVDDALVWLTKAAV
jgi:cephalosporin hydroxylase